MPVTRMLQLTEIDPPDTPVRSRMDDAKLAELCESMKQDGQIHPICVVDQDGRYMIKVGHRRYVAASMLGWTEIRAEVYHPSEWNGDAAMIAENRCREKVNPVDEALLFAEHQMRDNLDEAGLCARFHVSPDYLGDRFRLLRGDEKVCDALQTNQITFAVARELNKCPDQEHRRYLLDIAIRTGYSSRVMADHVRQWRANAAPTPAATPANDPIIEPQPVEPHSFACHFCGGHKDPWNIVTVQIHKHELEMFEAFMETLADPKTCSSNDSPTAQAAPRA